MGSRVATGWSEALQRHWWRAPGAIAPLPLRALGLALWPLSWLYSALVESRRAAYSAGLLRRHHVGVPVVVVGNLIVGGAGKTPTTLALVHLLRAAGWTPGIVSRGHGRRGGSIVEVKANSRPLDVGDEPLLLHRNSSAPVVVGVDRVAAARALLAQHPDVDLIVSDDGLQHLRLARDVEVIVFDERGVGNGHLLPAGPLREALPAKVPPQSLVLYNAAAPSTTLPGALAQRSLGAVLPLAAWWRGEAPAAQSWAALQSRRLLAVAGVAAPERFFTMLQARGLQIERLKLPDHHDFATLPWPAGTADVVLTEKDAVKLDPARLGSTQVWVATLDFTLDAAFTAALLARLPSRRPDHPPPRPARQGQPPS